MKQDFILLPQPRSLNFTGGLQSLPRNMRIRLDASAARQGLFAARSLQAALRTEAGLNWDITAAPADKMSGARLSLGSKAVTHKEGYELRVDGRGISLEAREIRGLLHGVSTLKQILTQKGRLLPRVVIRDHPDFEQRGLMLDVSRDKVPSMDTVYDLVDLLASWKINQIQLYTEHTFAYRNHRDVWKDASPFTGEEILALDRYCAERGVELVPNQNSFGHMRRWLTLPAYRDLADAPDGCDTAWGWFDEPFTLNPLDPRCLSLLRELFDELLPHFASGQFNVGCDETMDLGKVKSRHVAEKIGVGRLYLDFLLKIYKEVKARGKTMQFWGDIILHHPELIRRLPKDVVALSWGYEFDHPFDKECRAFKKAGLSFYVCPGTSSWRAVTGRHSNMMGNILNAAENGLKNGATGLLNTDWGDEGHWQYQPFSYAGYAYGAALSWSLKTNRRADLAAALNNLVFHDHTGRTAQAILALGDAYQGIGDRIHNATPYGWSLAADLKTIRGKKGFSAAGWKRGRGALEKGLSLLSGARPQAWDGGLVLREVAAGAKLSIHGCDRALLALESNPRKASGLKSRLDKDMKGIIKDHRSLWMARNRPGGFRESVDRLEKARKAYSA